MSNKKKLEKTEVEVFVITDVDEKPATLKLSGVKAKIQMRRSILALLTGLTQLIER